MKPNEANIKIENAGGLVELLPFVLGYFPEDAMVIHSTTSPNFLAGPTATLPMPEDPADWQEVAEIFSCHFFNMANERAREPESVVIYLCRDPRSGQTAEETAETLRPLAKWLADSCVNHGVRVLTTVGVIAGRWWSYACATPGCCEGAPLPAVDARDSVTAELIRQGYSPGPHAREITAGFEPIGPDTAPGLSLAFDAAIATLSEQWRTDVGQMEALEETSRIIDAAMRDLRNGVTELQVDVVARLVLGLQDAYARDRAIEYSEDDDLPLARHLWSYLLRRCVPPHAEASVPLLTLLAWVSWRQNDKVTARLALQRALTINSDYELADLLHEAINNGESPQGLLLIAREARAERMREARHQSGKSN
ncbi:DUF4192 domain-containing protein [Streptomyces sp. NPDC095613]|uniref:DUF4192 domain-containing protein n=1 Tax=Streptomyces sp. NPDC095613 TaxID=3155540 RepID=UPI003319BC81